VKARRTIAVLLFVAVTITTVLAIVRFPLGTADNEADNETSSVAAQVSYDSTGRALITIGEAAQKDIGIVTVTLNPVVRPVEVEAYGFVLDPAPLSKLNADLASARASLDASSAQYRRTRLLYAEQKNASLRDLQTAEATFLNDKVRIETLEQQLRDVWGSEIGRMDFRSRAELVGALIDRREAVARVTAPVGEVLDGAPGHAQAFVLGHEQQPLQAQTVYEAPTINPQMQGQSFLLLIGTNQFRISPGAAVSARFQASAKCEHGVMVPRAAVVRLAGKEWIYRERGHDRFVRHEIAPAELTSEGYFVTDNLPPGTPIVVSGAQSLLSEELKAQIQSPRTEGG
jgi:hypothetical protein